MYVRVPAYTRTRLYQRPTFYGYQVAGYWGAPAGSTLQDPQSKPGEVCTAEAMFDAPRNSLALVPWVKVEVGVQLPLWAPIAMSKFTAVIV